MACEVVRDYGFTVIGYVYNNETYCPECVVKAMQEKGDVTKRVVIKDINATLNVLSNTKFVDNRHDVWEYDNEEVPKEIFDIDAEYGLDICKICDRMIDG